MSGFDTRSIHDGEPSPPIDGAVTPPTFRSTTYVHEGPGDEVRYARYGNTPNHGVVEAKLASLTGAEAACVTASGMAAISSVLLGHLGAGDHAVVAPTLYGGTRSLLTDLLADLDIAHNRPDGTGPEAWAAAVRPETKVLYVESISNPLLEVPDLEGLAEVARRHDLLAVIDNTFGSPVNVRPTELGFDAVIHSATKYLGGHSDLTAGVVAGSSAAVGPSHEAVKLLGGTLAPEGCALLHRSLKTLGPRVRKQNATARALADAFAAHPAVAEAVYPGLPDHPDHERAARFFDGFGGMVALRLAEDADPDAFLEALSLPAVAPSLGGTETLVTRPAHTSHRTVDPEVRTAMGITERFVRVSTGLEDANDLAADFTQALDAAAE
jgi:cystathionine gamma-synthase/cystathionine gamma-lyase/cystathionine beta-lyase